MIRQTVWPWSPDSNRKVSGEPGAVQFFLEINRKLNPEQVKYDIVDSYGKLMELVGILHQ